MDDDELRRFYLASLPPRQAALEAARAQLAGASRPDALVALRKLAHLLAGSGTTYGFPAVTAAARAVLDSPELEVAAAAERLQAVLAQVGGGPGTAAGRAAASQTQAATTQAATTPSTVSHAVLVVDADPEVAAVLRARLPEHLPGATVAAAGTAAEAERHLELTPVAAIVLGLVLPDRDGRDLLRRLRSGRATGPVPIVALAPRGATQARVEALALGATACLERPLDGAALAAAVAACARRDPPGVAHAEAAAGVDRATFAGAVARLAADPRGGGTATSAVVAVVAIDSFDAVCAAHGASAGDALVARLLDALRACSGPDLHVVRGGAGGTVMALRRGTVDEARTELEQALHAFRSGEVPVRATFSAGVSPVRPGASVEDGVLAAWGWLYVAERDGGAQVRGPDDAPAPPPGAPQAARRVLMADDDDLAVAPLKAQLERAGYPVVHVHDGAAALSLAAVSPPALCLLDVCMPLMDGFELLVRLRALPSLARVPIVMVTSLGREEDVARGFDLGADDYVVKPYSVVEAMARIRRLLGRHDLPPEQPHLHEATRTSLPVPGSKVTASLAGGPAIARAVAAPPAGDPASATGAGHDTQTPTIVVKGEEEARSPEGTLVGRTVAGKYEVQEEVGRGGMGRVYRARHALLGTDLALKVVAPGLVHDADVRERFLREARALAALNHPHVIAVRDCGLSEDGLLYMTMDFSTGRTLRAVLRAEGRLSVERSVSIARQCLLALGEAHRRGLVHRDVKPGNIMIEAGDQGRDVVKLCDFGLAKSLVEEDVDVTRAQVVGSPAYMSPEQAQGKVVDARTDIYSLGCVLYEMLTGRLVFEHAAIVDLVHAHIAAPPEPPSRACAEVPPPLEAVVLRALSKSPDARFQSAQAFLDGLTDALLRPAPAKRALTARLRAPRALPDHAPPAQVVVTCIGASTLTAFVLRDADLLPVGAPAATAASPVQAVPHPTAGVAYVVHDTSASATTFGLRAGKAPAAEHGHLELGDGAAALAVAPDGRHAFVAHAASNDVSSARVDPRSGKLSAPARRVPVGSGPRALLVHPSGRLLLVACRAAAELTVLSVDPDSGALTPVGRAGTGVRPRALALDAAGHTAYVACAGSSEVCAYSVSADGKLEALGRLPIPGEPGAIALCPSGARAYVACTRTDCVAAFSVDERGRLRQLGPPASVGKVPCSLAVDARGRVFACAYGSDELWALCFDEASATLRVLGAVRTGKNPYSVAVAPLAS